VGELDQIALKDAHARLLARQAAEQELRDLETEAEVKSRYLCDVRSDLERARVLTRQNEPLARWRTILEQVRDLVHRDALPAEVVAWYADQLVRHTMTYLKMFDAEFELFVARDLTLMGMFANKTMPVSRLSGGQKNMLNISMRLAMIDMFPSELRLLILDEVEVHLDQRNVAKLPVVLERVKGLARGRELVVLFVSHHPSLSGVADHVIHIQAQNA
jgi:DNA repair exonuclease SbcCD ATPase subunit